MTTMTTCPNPPYVAEAGTATTTTSAPNDANIAELDHVKASLAPICLPPPPRSPGGGRQANPRVT